jgi:hypothetical protein
LGPIGRGRLSVKIEHPYVSAVQIIATASGHPGADVPAEASADKSPCLAPEFDLGGVIEVAKHHARGL